MQPNTITLAVDVANSGSTTNQVYTRVQELVNRSTYSGVGDDFRTADRLQLYATPPTRAGAFFGSIKSSAKLTETVSVAQADGVDGSFPLIAEVSFSVPVGTPAAKVKEIRQRLLALLDQDVIMDPLNIKAIL